MRLLHLYSGNLYGGIERVLVTLAQTRAPDIEQRFALFFDGRLAQELFAAGADLSIVGRASLSQPWSFLHARRALSRVLWRAQPDIVLAHSPWVLAVAGPVIRGSGARSALWLHNPPAAKMWPDGWALRQHLDTVLANSPFTAEAAAPAVRLAGWLYPPVPPPPPSARDARAATRSQLGASDDDVVILQASRVEAWKGVREHLAAVAHLTELSHWVLWIAGAPQRRRERTYFDQLRADAASYGIADRVRFLGHRTDIPELMAAADIYCQPNLEPEPFGVALVEAMWAGRPIVTTMAGGLAAEIATPESPKVGIVVPAGDSSAVATALRALVLSADLRESLGSRGPSLAAHLCDPSRQLQRLAALLAPAAEPLSIR
ncbi:MAG: glycosyltransferase [Acidobacteria bacterium]|nr:glycosyltransferase [Acidobacteriota bacterium]